MPIPKPKKDEKKSDFISRCVDNETMKDEYSDNQQRLAICYNAWKESKDKSKSIQESVAKELCKKE